MGQDGTSLKISMQALYEDMGSWKLVWEDGVCSLCLTPCEAALV
jgi:hypothetical protein